MHEEQEARPVRMTWAGRLHEGWIWLAGCGRRAMTSHEAVLARKIEALEASARYAREEQERLRAEADAANKERDMARLEVSLLHAILERDRARVEAETARFTSKQARAEAGIDD